MSLDRPQVKVSTQWSYDCDCWEVTIRIRSAEGLRVLREQFQSKAVIDIIEECPLEDPLEDELDEL